MTKTKQAIHIDNIYWERVQLYIEGHSEGVDLTSGQFVLRNLTETKTLEANEMKIDGNTFICRFNVAILDDGYYLPMDKYLFVYHDQLEYIGQLNPNIIDQAYAALNEEQIEEYNILKEAKQYYSHQIRVRIYQGISSMYMMSYYAKK